MGLTWSMEAVSWIFDANSTSFFIVSDVANCMHGFVIFTLFVCRSKTINAVSGKALHSDPFNRNSLMNSQKNSASNEEYLMKILRS